MNAQELEPCPFCGFNATILDPDTTTHEMIACINDDCPFNEWMTRAEWNRRTPSPDPIREAEISALNWGHATPLDSIADVLEGTGNDHYANELRELDKRLSAVIALRSGGKP